MTANTSNSAQVVIHGPGASTPAGQALINASRSVQQLRSVQAVGLECLFGKAVAAPVLDGLDLVDDAVLRAQRHLDALVERHQGDLAHVTTREREFRASSDRLAVALEVAITDVAARAKKAGRDEPAWCDVARKAIGGHFRTVG